MNAVAASRKSVYDLLNRYPQFWKTCVGSLQTAAIVALGRIFDQNSPHNIDKLLQIAQANPEIFSKQVLGQRKQGNNSERPEWLDDFLRTTHVPTPMDFRRIRAHIKKRRKIYEHNYRDLRHKVFVHKEVAAPNEMAALFQKTNIRELQQIFAFLNSLYEVLWQLFFNGRKPVLRPIRYSVKQMRRLPSPDHRSWSLPEKITRENRTVLRICYESGGQIKIMIFGSLLLHHFRCI